jgi:predicted DNA binding CopG/RHH family protein
MSFKRFNICMPDEIYKIVKEKADEKGIGVSTYIRLCVLEDNKKNQSEVIK